MSSPKSIQEVIHHNYVLNVLYDVHFPLFVSINLLINHMKCQVYENILFAFYVILTLRVYPKIILKLLVSFSPVVYVKNMVECRMYN